MKKVFFILSLALAALNFMSCSDDEASTQSFNDATPSEDVYEEWKAFHDSVQALNLRTFGAVYENQEQTRLGKFWKWLAKVVTSDANSGLTTYVKTAGNADIAVVAAVVSSLITAVSETINDTKPEKTTALKKSSSQSYPFQSSPLKNILFANGSMIDSIGYYHNKIILDFYNANTSDYNLSYISSDSVVAAVCTQLEIAKSYQADILVNSLTGNSTYMDYIQGIKANLLLSQLPSDYLLADTNINSTQKANLKNAVSELEDYIAKIDNLTPAQLRSYTANLIETINSTLTSQLNRDMMKSGVLIAFASNKLWKDKEVEE